MSDDPGPGPRILLVEDEPANRALVGAVFATVDRPELHGIVLHEATTIAEARAALASHSIDIVLVDVRLPDGSGLDLAAELTRQPRVGPAKVVIVSASVLPAERSSAIATGADGFLAKPFDPADLIELIVGLART